MIQKSYDKTPTLYVIPTPIGNMGDMTFRAVEVLNSVEVIFCEDTRVTAQLLNHYNIKKKLISNHKYNENEIKEKLLEELNDGHDIALVSDRGMPGVSDPGYIGIKYIIENNFNVVALPGASAFLPALIMSGICPQPFLFYGFLNSKNSKRKEELNGIKAKNIEELDIFNQGYFTVQDEGAGLIAKILDPKPNERILDACSSPGGKTTYMAELMQDKGEIIAWDLHLHRVALVEENAKRLGIHIIKTKCQDAMTYEENYKEKFDKILLDVPCLGMGVLKRKPDIKWKRSPKDIEKITEIQQKILDTCSKYLKSK